MARQSLVSGKFYENSASKDRLLKRSDIIVPNFKN